MLVVIGQFSARHILLRVRSAKISGIFDTMVVYHQVCLTAMTNKSLELTQISQEDW